MEIDDLLRSLRENIKTLAVGWQNDGQSSSIVNFTHEVDQVIDQFQALDRRLSSGGNLPEDWDTQDGP